MRRRRGVVIPLAIALVALAFPAAGEGYLVGVADEGASMFVSPLYTQLVAPQPASHRISRYIAPYDVANGNRKNLFYLDGFINWYRHAQAGHVQMLVAFYHSELTPTRMPSMATYRREVQRFIKRFPAVKAWQPWNEANRGSIRHVLASPSASASARYYQALRSVCHKCTVVALDILDQANARPTLRYIAEFKADVRHLRIPTPHLWGLHNYSDTNRSSSTRTKAILAAVPGDVWLTETGGIVKFGREFPNRRGSGDRRAAKALTYMFEIAGRFRRIKRLYIFEWSGSNAGVRFDAGLLDAYGVPRPGYGVVCKHLHAKRCNGLKLDSRN